MAVILNLHGCGEKLQKNASKTNNKDYVMKGLQLKLINLVTFFGITFTACSEHYLSILKYNCRKYKRTNVMLLLLNSETS